MRLISGSLCVCAVSEVRSSNFELRAQDCVCVCICVEIERQNRSSSGEIADLLFDHVSLLGCLTKNEMVEKKSRSCRVIYICFHLLPTHESAA